MIFITRQLCICSDDPECCTAPGQSEKEIAGLVKAIKGSMSTKTIEVCDIRDVKIAGIYPQAIELFKKHKYDSLPIIMVDKNIVSYGIPDKEFVINSIKKEK